MRRLLEAECGIELWHLLPLGRREAAFELRIDAPEPEVLSFAKREEAYAAFRARLAASGANAAPMARRG